MKKFIKLLSTCAVALTIAGCTCSQHTDCPYKHQHQNYKEMSQYETQNHQKQQHQRRNKIHSKMYTRNNYGEPSEIGYIKFYDINDGVKMVVNVDKLRNGIDYTTKIYQCKDAKCTNPDTCCMETYMALEMPLTRKNKNNPMLQETFIINNVTTGQLQGATVFFERNNGYRAAWGFLD